MINVESIMQKHLKIKKKKKSLERAGYGLKQNLPKQISPEATAQIAALNQQPSECCNNLDHVISLNIPTYALGFHSIHVAVCYGVICVHTPQIRAVLFCTVSSTCGFLFTMDPGLYII